MPGLDNKVPYFLQNTNEQPIPEESSILGKLPSYVRGTILAVAPGIFDLPKGSFNHWMDGLALLQRFEINESTVKFSKRFVQSDTYKKAIKAGKPCSVELGTYASTDSKKGFFSKLKPYGPYDITDNCIGALCKLGSKDTILVSDTSYFHKINPSSLETVEQNHCLKTFGINSFSPFPIKDLKTGDIYNLATSATNGSFKYHVVRMKAENDSAVLEKKFATICTIPSRWFTCISLIRCFGISENYFVFVEQPAAVNGLKYTATNMKGYTARDWIEWKMNELNRFYLVDKRTGTLNKLEIYSEKPFHSLMVLNVFEDDNLLVFDCVTVPNLDAIDDCYLNNIRQLSLKREIELSHINRFIIPLNLLKTNEIKNLPENINLLDMAKINFINPSNTEAKAIRKGDAIYLTPATVFDDPVAKAGFDFGVINGLFKGKRYSYFFATPGLCSISSNYFGMLCKINVNTGDIKTWKPTNDSDIDRSHCISIPLFISNPRDGNEEDDGVLIATVSCKRKEDKNFLVFIDGKSFEEIGRCYFEEKIAVSASFTFFD